MRFFFSSRRRHTRCYRDWSSDVCSSDLRLQQLAHGREQVVEVVSHAPGQLADRFEFAGLRSEERRVGKECKWESAPDNQKKAYKGQNVLLWHDAVRKISSGVHERRARRA